MVFAYALLAIAASLGVIALWADGLALWARGLFALGFLAVASITDWVRCRTCGLPVLWQSARALSFKIQDPAPRTCPGCGQDRMWRTKLRWLGWYPWMRAPSGND